MTTKNKYFDDYSKLVNFGIYDCANELVKALTANNKYEIPLDKDMLNEIVFNAQRIIERRHKNKTCIPTEVMDYKSGEFMPCFQALDCRNPECSFKKGNING